MHRNSKYLKNEKKKQRLLLFSTVKKMGKKIEVINIHRGFLQKIIKYFTLQGEKTNLLLVNVNRGDNFNISTDKFIDSWEKNKNFNVISMCHIF